MKSKTAVQWFEYMLENWDVLLPEIKKAIIEQAKEMEKEQIIDAYKIGFVDAWVTAIRGDEPNNANAEEYYNETFKKTEQDER